MSVPVGSKVVWARARSSRGREPLGKEKGNIWPVGAAWESEWAQQPGGKLWSPKPREPPTHLWACAGEWVAQGRFLCPLLIRKGEMHGQQWWGGKLRQTPSSPDLFSFGHFSTHNGAGGGGNAGDPRQGDSLAGQGLWVLGKAQTPQVGGASQGGRVDDSNCLSASCVPDPLQPLKWVILFTNGKSEV